MDPSNQGITPQTAALLIQKAPWACAVFTGNEYSLASWNRTFASWFDPQGKTIPNGLKAEDFLDVELKDPFKHTFMPHVRVFGHWEGSLTLRDMWGSDYEIYACIVCLHPAGESEQYTLLAVKSSELSAGAKKDELSDRELLHALLQTLPMSVYFKDLNSRFIRTSAFKANKHGFSDPSTLVGLTDFDLFTVEHAQHAFDTEQQIIKTGEAIMDVEERETYAGDHITWASSSKFPLLNRAGAIVGSYGISRDITAQKALEAERLEMEAQQNLSQKLESIGRLASGVAHEINTPAQFITDNVQFLKTSLAKLIPLTQAFQELHSAVKASEDTSESCEKIDALLKTTKLQYLLGEIPQTIEDSLEGLGRVRGIVRSLKEFSHSSRSSKGKVDINRCLETTVAVSRHEWRYVADITLKLDPDLPSINGNYDEINQVFLNMIVNAAHAIEEASKAQGRADKGIVEICTKRAPLGRVEITIQDNGNGIPADIRDRIFDPFFTTKEVGKGTGQGLAICRTIIIKNHGGTVDLESEVGKGTRFTLTIPIGEAERPADEAVQAAP